ncbi:MAG: ubiquinol-cytochrome C chaperone family protein [Pseudomonadota bacterium]
MFKSLFKKDKSAEIGEALYVAAADHALSPPFFRDFGAPDTPEGRFEVVALHVWLILRRLKGEDPAAKRAAQKLLDSTFSNLDAALREMGVGDLVVGKKVRKLAENFYGRLGAYDAGLAADADAASLEEALARNVYESETAKDASALANYVRAAAEELDTQPQSRIANGIVTFPKPGPAL